MSNFLGISNLILSGVTVTAAVIAIFQTQRQIKLSNKQQLFDRRVKCYMFVKDLLSLYTEHKNLLNKESIYYMVKSEFTYFTNCVELEEMANVIGNTENEEKRRIFLTKSENFEKVAIEIGLLWKGDEAKLISEFVRGYRKLLIELYRQQLEINYWEKQRDDDLLKRELTSDVYFAKLKEEAEKRGLFKAMDNLNDLYNRIIETKAEEKLVESMKL